MRNYIRLVVACLIAALPVSTLVAQTAKDWYAPQSITRIDKKTYKEITNSFREQNSMDLVFHFEKSHWSIHRMDSDDKELLEDSAYVSDLKSDFEDAVVKKSGIFRRDEFTPPIQCDFTLHVLIKKVTKDAGITASGLIVYRDSIPFARMDMSVDDGRWNDFSTLFVENGEKMGKNLRKIVAQMREQLTFYKKFLLVTKE